MNYIFYSDKTPQSCSIALGWAAYGKWGRFAYSEEKDPSGAETYSFKLESIPTLLDLSRPHRSATFYGKIKPHQTGSVIEGHFRIPWWYKIFLGILVLPWYAFSGPMFVLSLIDVIESRGTSNSAYNLSLFLWMIIGPTIVVVGTIYNIRREERRVANMLLSMFPKDGSDTARNSVHHN
jgi:hypothetical protein